MDSIYKCSDMPDVLDIKNGSCVLTANRYGKGRSVYIAGLPYNMQNTRVQLRSVYWSAGKENEMYKWFSENPKMECNAYPEAGRFVIINNDVNTQKGTVVKEDGHKIEVELEPLGYKWFDI